MCNLTCMLWKSPLFFSYTCFSFSFFLLRFYCVLTKKIIIIQLTATTSTDQPLVLLTTENLKNNREYSELFNNLVSEYDRRLEEQVKFAKQDMLRELEVQIQVSQLHVFINIVNRFSIFFAVLFNCISFSYLKSLK